MSAPAPREAPRAKAPGDGYWAHARTPFACLIFLTPLLILYECGVHWLGGARPELVRNGADHWMRQGLDGLGLGFSLLMPVFVVVGLLAWQICGKYSWKVAPDTLVGMSAESLLFAFCLIVLGQMQDMAFQQAESLALLDTDPMTMAVIWPRIVSFVGAGLYEEFLFRLCLLPVCYLLFRALLLPKKWAAAGAILMTSFAFALAHHIPAGGDPFSWMAVWRHAAAEPFNLTFRLIAGLFFAVLFVTRGFGITVGCHAAYDVLVGVLLQLQP